MRFIRIRFGRSNGTFYSSKEKSIKAQGEPHEPHTPASLLLEAKCKVLASGPVLVLGTFILNSGSMFVFIVTVLCFVTVIGFLIGS